jgi:hypothetical protein
MMRRTLSGPGIGSWSAWLPLERKGLGKAYHDACYALFLKEIEDVLKRDPAARRRIERLVMELREAIFSKMFH